MDQPNFRVIITFILVFAILPGCRCFAVLAENNLFTDDRIIDCQAEYETQMQLRVLDVEYMGKGELEGIYVSEAGCFLLVFAEGTQHYINVFNQDCMFEYQIAVKESGTLLAIPIRLLRSRPDI